MLIIQFLLILANDDHENLDSDNGVDGDDAISHRLVHEDHEDDHEGVVRNVSQGVEADNLSIWRLELK